MSEKHLGWVIYDRDNARTSICYTHVSCSREITVRQNYRSDDTVIHVFLMYKLLYPLSIIDYASRQLSVLAYVNAPRPLNVDRMHFRRPTQIENRLEAPNQPINQSDLRILPNRLAKPFLAIAK